jgi:2-polyprenyl-3-methyl-5-hydroxy-6-metoxy-1,4-benzoquinol methylase
MSQGPEFVMQLLQGAQASAVLSTAIELGVFAAVGGGADAKEVAARIGCPERSTRILCDALAAFGLFGRDGARYTLSPTAEAHLVPGRPAYMGDVAQIVVAPEMWSGLGRLAEAVRQDGSVLESHAETPRHPFWETFARASTALAAPAAAALEGGLHKWLASLPRASVLDVAAGSGLYGYTIAQKNPNVELTSLDWPNVLVETRKNAERMKLDAARLHTIEGNLFEVEWGGPYELIVMSHIFHHFDRPTCAALMKRAAAALAPGGRVAVHDFLAGSGHPGAALFSITMLVWTRHGEAFVADDYRAWMAEAGLRNPAVHAVPMGPTSLVFAEKPQVP